MYNPGTLKVAWAEDNPEIMASVMFPKNDIEKAIEFGEQKGNYMLMRLIDSDKDNYRWLVLPYGEYKGYMTGINAKRVMQPYTNIGKMSGERIASTRIQLEWIVAGLIIFSIAMGYKGISKTLKAFLIILSLVLFVMGIRIKFE